MPDGSSLATDAILNLILEARDIQLDKRIQLYVDAGVLDEEQAESLAELAVEQPEAAKIAFGRLNRRIDGMLGTLPVMPADRAGVLLIPQSEFKMLLEKCRQETANTTTPAHPGLHPIAASTPHK